MASQRDRHHFLRQVKSEVRAGGGWWWGGAYLWETEQVDVGLRDLHGTQQAMALSSSGLFLGAAGTEVVLGSMGNSGLLEETSSSCRVS